ARMRLELHAHLGLLSETRHARVFQDQSPVAVARALLEAWGIPHRLGLARVHAAWPYCVQYQESDLAFLQRILAAEGVFFSRAPDGAAADPFEPATVVLGDSPGAIGSFDDPTTALPVALDGSALAAGVETISRLGRRVAVAPSSVELRDY